jgi:hypothetical protein
MRRHRTPLSLALIVCVLVVTVGVLASMFRAGYSKRVHFVISDSNSMLFFLNYPSIAIQA